MEAGVQPSRHLGVALELSWWMYQGDQGWLQPHPEASWLLIAARRLVDLRLGGRDRRGRLYKSRPWVYVLKEVEERKEGSTRFISRGWGRSRGGGAAA